MNEELKSIIIDSVDFQGEVKLKTRFVEDMGMDSLDSISLLISLEDSYNISIEDDFFAELKTAGDIQSYLKGKGVL